MRELNFVVVGDDPPLIQHSPHLEKLRRIGNLTLHRNRPHNDDEKIRRLQNAQVLINSRGQVKWPGVVLRQLPELKLISLCSIGTDSIDVAAARELGITVCHVPGRTIRVVAEHAFALMLAVSRKAARMTELMRRGQWPWEISVSLTGKTLGVIGTGRIGCELIRLARGFGMNVVAWSFHPDERKAQELDFQYAEFDDVLGSSDVVSVHVKLTPDSHHLIDSRALGLMRSGALLVNTSRGQVVEHGALVTALNTGHLGGAALDVFPTEPLPADDPILKCEQLVLTPHAADQVPEGIEALSKGCVENVLNFLDGRPTNVV